MGVGDAEVKEEGRGRRVDDFNEEWNFWKSALSDAKSNQNLH